MLQNKGFRFFSITTVCIWLGVFALLPNMALFLVSFLDRTDTSFFIPVLTLDNYLRLFAPAFIRILLKSLALACVSTLTCLILGYPFAYLLARSNRRVRPWLFLLVIIPFWTNSLVRTYAIFTILQNNGVLNTLFNRLGLVEGNFSLMYTNFSVFMGLTYTLLPFMILPLYASIEKLNLRLLEAAKDLGAGPVRSFLHVTLPLTLPGIAAGSILVFLPSLSLFYVPEILGGINYRLLGSFIQYNFSKGANWPVGAAASTVLTLLLLLMAVFYRLAGRNEREGGAAALSAPGGQTAPARVERG
ncbi:MAG: ABC transporter permease subunit [Deltaproteobacteria bacterium]|jgi:spermidine/putrescine transport system permease protein|nr:ABC transporter permease subunit [Deltaproteobacteria bacterium]